MAKAPERGFRYQERSRDDLKERANMRGGNFDTIFKPKFKQWKPKDGKNLIRVLPPTWKDARHYGLDIFVNYNIGADNQSYLSLSKHEKGADPLEEAKRGAQLEGGKALAKALTPTQRILYWIIDRSDEGEGPLLWAAPFTFDKSLSNLCIDEDTKDVMFIDSPETGRDVRFYKEGTGLATKYDSSKMKVLAESLIHEDEGLEKEWLDYIYEHPLPEVLNFYEYDHIKAVFGGQAGRRDDDQDNELPERPPVRGGDTSRMAGRERPSNRSPRVPETEALPWEDDDARNDVVPATVSRHKTPNDNGGNRARSRAAVVDEGEVDPGGEPAVRPRRGAMPEADAEPPVREGRSLRERLAARRRSPSTDDE